MLDLECKKRLGKEGRNKGRRVFHLLKYLFSLSHCVCVCVCFLMSVGNNVEGRTSESRACTET
jgi:hypothetical protein